MAIKQSLNSFFLRSLLLLWAASACPAALRAADVRLYNYVVAQDGSGDFTTVQAAIDDCPNGSGTATTVFIKNGIYNEKVKLASQKTNVHLYGQDAEKVIIRFNDIGNDYKDSNGNVIKTGVGTMLSATFQAEAAGFYAENITFENNFGVGSQAVAIRTAADRQTLKNCCLLSFQDTHYAHNASARQYLTGCYIEGATDYIFGSGTVLYDGCEFRCLKGGQYISAPATTSRTYTNSQGSTVAYGLILRDCKITAGSDVPARSYYFMRPWKEKASTVLINCKAGSHINPKGFTQWGSTSNGNEYNGYYAEYGTTDLNGNAADYSNRPSWSVRLSQSDAEKFYGDNKAVFRNSASDIWDPLPLTQAPGVPQGLKAQAGSLTWSAVDGAVGYLVERDNYAIAFTKSNSWTDGSAPEKCTYKVAAIGPNGNLSGKAVLNAQNTGLPAIPDTARLVKHGAGASTQTVKADSAIAGFYFDIVKADDVTVTGLPNGITATVDTQKKTVTIAGTASDAPGRYDYAITTVGSNVNVTKQGSITIEENTSTSAKLVGSENATLQAVCSAGGVVEIGLAVAQSGHATLALLSPEGQVLLSATVPVHQGQNHYTAMLGNVAPGIYILVAKSGHWTLMTKLAVK